MASDNFVKIDQNEKVQIIEPSVTVSQPKMETKSKKQNKCVSFVDKTQNTIYEYEKTDDEYVKSKIILVSYEPSS
jgi:hypothetical protein